MSTRQPSPLSPNRPGGNPGADILQQILQWPALLAGLGFGLVLGLFLAWYVWPVQWVNAWPGELNPEARAHYLATVAEAYTYYGDERAAEIARYRLFDLNANLAQEIAAAQAYFNDNPQRDSRTHIVNLNSLARALNVDSPDLLTDPGAPAAAAPAPGVVSSGLLDWLNWIFIVIAAVVLIAGGVFIVYERSRRRQAADTELVFTAADSDEEIGGFEPDEEWDMPDEDGAIYRRPLAATAVHPPRGAPPEGDAYLDLEDEDEEEDAFFADEYDEAVFARPGMAGADEAKDDVDDMGEDEEPVAPGGAPLPPAPVAKPSAEGTAGVAHPPSPKSGTATAPRGPRTDILLCDFTANYVAGLFEYEETREILDADGHLIGECGMGVHMGDAYLNGNPEHVMALDVYLFDKREGRRSSQNQILFSKYVVENNLEHTIPKERSNDPEPILAAPNARFRLVSHDIAMDCEVLDVVYFKDGDTSGIFQSIKVRLRTYRDRR